MCPPSALEFDWHWLSLPGSTYFEAAPKAGAPNEYQAKRKLSRRLRSRLQFDCVPGKHASAGQYALAYWPIKLLAHQVTGRAHCELLESGPAASVPRLLPYRRLRAGRRVGHPREADRPMAVGAVRPALRRRQPAGRRWQYRHRGGRQGKALVRAEISSRRHERSVMRPFPGTLARISLHSSGLIFLLILATRGSRRAHVAVTQVRGFLGCELILAL